MVEWLAGNRIIGTTAERPALGLPSGSVGGWVELARTTLGSNNANINISSIPDKRYYMLLSRIVLTGAGTGGGMRLGSGSADTGSNYAFRGSNNGLAEGVYPNRVDAHWVGGWGAVPEFYVTYIANKSDKEKLVMAQRNYGALGSNNSTNRTEFAGKWTNTSNPLDYINYYQGGSDTYASGSELVLLGWDPADTHTTNFWEELASVDLSGGDATSLSTGTFTAKKYLWVQFFGESSGGNIQTAFQFNSDTGSNYAFRASVNGGTDSVLSSRTQIGDFANSPNNDFTNMFIVNNSANEKLAIGNIVFGQTAGAGTAPNRAEYTGKWANTSSQITEINVIDVAGAGQFGTKTTMKVWGSD